MTVSLKNLFTVAALSSLSAGILLTLIQQFQVVPAIIEAESYEQSPAVEHGASESGHVHAHTESDHAHDDSAWAPQDGLQRTLFTAGANIVIALGFALLIGAATVLRGITLNWRTGLLWGLAGYAVFFVAPSLGLHPELPGTAAADLQSRQYWWLATIACSAVGLALLVFSPRVVLKILGGLLILLPHVVGAPLPDVHSALAPADLIQRFIIATIIANAVFWLALGGLYGFFQQKLVH
ncbi:Predicted cobalt transporter CbtA [hydrothermal vent metagenome]|uniref:Predicted cobalt transporter CbtA n=1 Tax=hydrothermal vent metagenome TaxID=652676 RepID=A0A3B1AMM0_9ZZZZ